ncbi:MAG: YggS family pyridoxal phosphate-dependent enzyme [Thermomicrobiales bacterium]
MSAIESRLLHLQQRIECACQASGRNLTEITLIGVSKTVDRAAIDAAYAAGLRDFGENRVQDATAKLVENWPSDARRHLVGSLQSNKAAVAVRIFDLIHSVDRPSLIDELRKQAVRQERQVAVLLQVNIAMEPQKSGCDPTNAQSLARSIAEAPELDLKGLMTIAPLVERAELARPVFTGLRELRDQMQDTLGVSLPVLSMGMTNDFEIAIEEGATHLRIGRALFNS